MGARNWKAPNCWLLVDGVNKLKRGFICRLITGTTSEPLPTSFWTEDVEAIALPKADGIGSLLPAARQYRLLVRCRSVRCNWVLRPDINPKGVIDYLHYYRSFKTDNEPACMLKAQKMAVSNGHRAAEEAFRSGI